VLTNYAGAAQAGVVGKFVEFYGPELRSCRWRIEHHQQHGAGIWRDLRHLPVDAETLRYLRLTGRGEDQIALVEAYYKERGCSILRIPLKPSTRRRWISIWPPWSRAWRAKAAAGSRAAEGCGG